jgi:nucleoid-associated protein YgaU
MGRGERDEHDFQRRKSLEDIARRHYGKAKEYLKASFTTQFP